MVRKKLLSLICVATIFTGASIQAMDQTSINNQNIDTESLNPISSSEEIAQETSDSVSKKLKALPSKIRNFLKSSRGKKMIAAYGISVVLALIAKPLIDDPILELFVQQMLAELTGYCLKDVNVVGSVIGSYGIGVGFNYFDSLALKPFFNYETDLGTVAGLTGLVALRRFFFKQGDQNTEAAESSQTIQPSPIIPSPIQRVSINSNVSLHTIDPENPKVDDSVLMINPTDN